MKKYCSLLIFLLPAFLPMRAADNNPLLQSGPMVGYSEFREVLLWVQTSKAAEVQFEYWEKDRTGSKFLTSKKQTIKEEAFTARLLADQVQPGKMYTYRLLINGRTVPLNYPAEFRSQPLWRDKGTPPDFSVALGSCAFVVDSAYDDKQRTYGGDYAIFQSIHALRPDMMFWLGDNIYLREADWTTRTGIFHRYTHTRSLKELQPLLASTHHYAAWDDHDFGPNDSDRSYVHKDLTLEAFKLFWANPSYGLPGQPGITTQFTWGDVDFFMLDNRYFRAPQNRQSGERTMLGKDQLEWLIDALVFSEAKFKVVVVGGLVLSASSNVRNQNYISNYSEERAYLLKRLEEENIKNVVFVSGDKHFSELSKITNAKGNTVYDFTVSPLTSRANTRKDENVNRVEGTLVQERNFGMITFQGPPEKRTLTMAVYDAHGSIKWSKSIPEYSN